MQFSAVEIQAVKKHRLIFDGVLVRKIPRADKTVYKCLSLHRHARHYMRRKLQGHGRHRFVATIVQPNSLYSERKTQSIARKCIPRRITYTTSSMDNSVHNFRATAPSPSPAPSGIEMDANETSKENAEGSPIEIVRPYCSVQAFGETPRQPPAITSAPCTVQETGATYNTEKSAASVQREQDLQIKKQRLAKFIKFYTLDNTNAVISG